jgi:hypothetical protein
MRNALEALAARVPSSKARQVPILALDVDAAGVAIGVLTGPVIPRDQVPQSQ